MAKSTRLTDLENNAASAGEAGNSAAPAIPDGVPADVTVKYRTQVQPGARAYNDDLYELAAENNTDTARPSELPFDPVTQFCAEWRNYAGWLLKVTRLPDPATRRMAGQSYNRTCLEIESLGSIPFDPANLEGVLQIINGNSGGVFRVWLVDQNGQPVPEAFLDRVAIGDPPRQFGQQHAPFDPRYAPASYNSELRTPNSAPAPPTALESRMHDLQERLLNNALERLMQPPPVATPTSSLSDEDKLTLLLVKEGGILTNVVSKIAALAGSPETAAAKETLGERALNAGLRIAETNPAIVERISGTLERIMNRVLPDPRMPVNVASNLQRPALRTPHPELPNSQTPKLSPGELSEAEDQDIMDIVESLFTLLSDTRPFSVNDPVFTELRAEYPLKFRAALQMIATQPLDGIIAWLSEQSALYESLLASPVTGPHYRGRLEALQTFCRTPPPSATAPASAENIDAQTTDKTGEPESA